MAIALRRIRDRIRGNLRDYNLAHPVRDPVEVDQAICDAYLELGSRLPAPELLTTSGLTISAGADTFQLPSTVTQWTANDGGAEYASLVRIRLRSTGQFLSKLNVEEIDAFRNGQSAVLPSIPQFFALWEDKTQGAQGRCYPGAAAAEVCDLFVRLNLDDLRDFIGTGSDDMDDVKLQFSRLAADALVYQASGWLLASIPNPDADALGIDKSIAPVWLKAAASLAYGEALRRNNLETVGRTQRRVS